MSKVYLLVSAEQAIRVKRLKQVREAWELFTETHKLVEQSILNKASDIISRK